MQVSHIPAWKSSPFVRIILAFVPGIILQRYMELPLVPTCIIASFIFLLILLLPFLSPALYFRYRYLQGILLNLFVIATGMLITRHADPFKDPRHFINRFNTGNQLAVNVMETPIQKGNYYRTRAETKAIYGNEFHSAARGQMFLYFRIDSAVSVPEPGDVFLLAKAPVEIMSSGNPGSFDFRNYSRLQGISHQLFLNSSDYHLIAKQSGGFYSRFIIEVRASVLQTLRKYIPGKKECGLAEAMLIGYRADLDDELLQAYSNTGVVHLIAISGLHLGLIYALLAKLCTAMRIRNRVLRSIIILICLWLFSFVAGAGASVLRSAVMFSFILLGSSFKRKIPIVNSLAASAFVLLCFNPFWLWDIGFQLSYAAVLSIVLLMKPIYNLLNITNPLLDNLWQLNSVTIAAQVLTLPLTLYYFHQFPNYFLVSNLVAAPFSSLILLVEILLFPLSLFESAGSITGQLLYYMIQILNGYIEYCNRLPFATWPSLSITISQTICLFAAIFLIIQSILSVNAKYLFAALTSLFIFAIIRSVSFIKSTTQEKLVVYNIAAQQAIEWSVGRNCFLLADSSLLRNQKKVNFSIKPNHIQRRIKELHPILPADLHVDFSSKLTSLIMANSDQPVIRPSDAAKSHLIILSKNTRINLKDLCEKNPIWLIVFDRSNSVKNIKKWSDECEVLGIPFYNVAENGAFVMNMN